MRPHIEALGYLQITWGVFGLMTGASLGILAIGADAASLGEAIGTGERAAVVVLAVVGGALVTGGGLATVTGWALRRRRNRARQAALVLAVPNLLFVPFGTALGIYTFWVLLNDDARRAFGRHPEPLSSVDPDTGQAGGPFGGSAS